MSTERMTPNGVFVNETTENQKMMPSGQFINETAAPAGPTFNPAWAKQANQFIGVHFA